MGFDTKENVVGNYYLVAPDDEAQLSLDYCDPTDQSGGCGGVIGSTVFAVGYNEKYIIVKQHPRTFPNPPNKEVTNFFILPIKDSFNYRTMNNLIGPLTLEQFNDKRKELNIPDGLKFTITKDNLK
jgi:hypothetical protein